MPDSLYQSALIHAVSDIVMWNFIELELLAGRTCGRFAVMIVLHIWLAGG